VGAESIAHSFPFSTCNIYVRWESFVEKSDTDDKKVEIMDLVLAGTISIPRLYKVNTRAITC